MRHLVIVGLVTVPLSTASADTLRFSDQTAAIGLDASHDPADGFAFGPINLAPMIGGAVVGDFDNDGAPDIFLVGGGGLDGFDRLFLNDGTGQFTDVTVEWGVAERHKGLGAAVGDYDGDGWQDIFVCSLGVPGSQPQAGYQKLYRNLGGTGFEDVAEKAGVEGDMVDGLGAAFGDYDLDGDLDLLVACWAGAGSRLYRNDGDGTFTDVSAEAGVLEEEVRAFSPAFIDMNGDNYPELLLASDFGTSRYYVNNGDGTFSDWTGPSGTGLDGNGMGHAVGDFNLDGKLDWYVTSIHTPNGYGNIPGTGNMLYLQNAEHHYVEASIPMGVNDGGWGWGTVAVDLDHDGDEDLVETNGWPFANIQGILEWIDEPSYVFINNDGEFFTEEHEAVQLNHDLQGRALMYLDIENDGDMDLLFVNNDAPITVFRNDLDSDRHWLKVAFDTDANPRLAPRGRGAIVHATTGETTQIRSMWAGSTYEGMNELVLHFGLDDAEIVDELRVTWPDGTVTVLEDVAVDQTLVIEAGLGADVDGDGGVGVMDLIAVIIAWGTQDEDADVNADGTVDAQDLGVILWNWSS